MREEFRPGRAVARSKDGDSYLAFLHVPPMLCAVGERIRGVEMTPEESERLKVGDRVRYIEDAVLGTVLNRTVKGVFIEWEDGQKGWIAHVDAHVYQEAENR